jgi:hypothetical protein
MFTEHNKNLIHKHFELDEYTKKNFWKLFLEKQIKNNEKFKIKIQEVQSSTKSKIYFEKSNTFLDKIREQISLFTSEHPETPRE